MPGKLRRLNRETPVTGSRDRGDGRAEEGATGHPSTGGPARAHELSGSATRREVDSAREQYAAMVPGVPEGAGVEAGGSLAAAWRAFRRVAMIGPSDEELERMEEGDRQANTEWILGGTVGIVHEFTEFGARRDEADCHAQVKGEGSAPTVTGDTGNRGDAERSSPMRRRLAAAWRAFRRVAMIGPSDEELERMEEGDRQANTEWILGGTVGIVHEFTEFGARRDD